MLILEGDAVPERYVPGESGKKNLPLFERCGSPRLIFWPTKHAVYLEVIQGTHLSSPSSVVKGCRARERESEGEGKV